MSFISYISSKFKEKTELAEGELPPLTIEFDDDGEITTESLHANAIRFLYYELEIALTMMYEYGIQDDTTEALLGEISETIVKLQEYIRNAP